MPSTMNGAPHSYIDLRLAGSIPPPVEDPVSPQKKHLWRFAQNWLFRLSPHAYFMWWRRGLLRFFGAEIGPKVQLHPTVRVACPWNVIIGARTWIGDHAELYSLGRIVIGDDAVISQHVYLCTGTHDYHRLDFPLVTKAIQIKNEAWIGTRSFIGPGVIVGQGAIVGAQSVVVRDVMPATIVAGNPAVPIKTRPVAQAPLELKE